MDRYLNVLHSLISDVICFSDPAVKSVRRLHLLHYRKMTTLLSIPSDSLKPRSKFGMLVGGNTAKSVFTVACGNSVSVAAAADVVFCC